MKHKVGTAVTIANRFLSSGDTVLEIGAADGEYARIYAVCVGPTGHVFAVEPERRHLRVLSALSETMPWVTVRSGAVGATAGEALFYSDQVNPKRSSLWSANVPAPGDAYLVPVMTVDALVASMPRTPRIIQVDAQGAEAGILAGARKTLTLPIVWIIELWSSGLMHAGSSVGEVMDSFQAHAYTPCSLMGKRLDWDDAQAYAIGRSKNAHADFVMVPEDLMEADW